MRHRMIIHIHEASLIPRICLSLVGDHSNEMAALKYLNNKRLRACRLKHLVPRARQLGGARTSANASVGESMRSIMAPHGHGTKPVFLVKELRVLFPYGLGSCRSLIRAGGDYCLKSQFVRISTIRKFIHTTQVPFDEEQTTDFLYKELLSAIENELASNHQISVAFLNSHKICSNGNPSSPSTLLDYLHGNGIFLSHNCYINLLATSSERNCMDLSTQIFKHLLVCRVTLSSAAYCSLAKAFREAPDSMKLLSFVREVSELTDSPRSTIILNRIILSFAESRQIDNALLIFEQMKSLKCKPDLITYNTILDILGRFGRVDEMFLELEKMKEEGLFPDVISYNTLLNSLRRMGRFDMCLRVKVEMDESGIEPDLLTYTALIEAFGRSGNIEQSLGLFNEMKVRQIHPSVYIYKSLVSNLQKMGKMELAILLMEEMESTRSELASPRDFKRKKPRSAG